MSFSYERRAHIARKLHYLDGWTAEAIAEYFEAENIASITGNTVERYFKQEPAAETIEKVRESMANEDLAIAESQQRKHDRARADEKLATKDESIEAVRPVTERNKADAMIRVPGWRVLPDTERPDHAAREDVFIEHTGDTRTIPPGGPYYVLDPEGNPEYETVLVGLARDQPNLAGRRSSRYEQKNHNEVKAQVLGIEEDTLNVDVGGSLELEHSVPEDVVEAVIGASQSRLDTNANTDAAADSVGGHDE